jgi:hypothetical protein
VHLEAQRLQRSERVAADEARGTGDEDAIGHGAKSG